MKTLALFLPLTLAAQEPLTYESFGNLFSAANFGDDSLPDVVVAEKASGIYSVAFSQAEGNVTWKQPTESGFTNLSGLAVGKFQTNESDDFALVAPLANRVTFWRPDVSADNPLVRHLYPGNPGTNLIAGFPADNDSIIELLAFGVDGENSTRELFEGDTSLWSDPAANPATRLWLVHHDRTPGVKPRAVFVSGTEVRSAIFSNAGANTLRTLPNYSASQNTRTTYGFFDGTDSAHLFFFEPGSTTASETRITNGAIGWTTPATITFPKPLELLATAPVGNLSRLVALYQDHTAALFDFDGNSLTFRANIAGTHDLLAPLGDNRLLSRDGDQWSTIDATSGLALKSGSLPGGKSGSNILFVSAEPFANPSATPLFNGQVANWTIAAIGGNQNWTVSSLTQSPDGLVPTPDQDINPNPGSDHALVNQFRPDISVSLINASPGPATGEIFISPGGGNFLPIDGEPLEIPVSFSTTFPDADVFYRLTNGGPWLPADANITLTSAGTLQAYAEWNGLRTPVRQAVFTSNASPHLGPGSFTDANNNGMSDQWEESFGLSDPNGDADGDGASNFAEFQNGTDPRNANSGAIELPFKLTVNLEGEEIIIRWPRSFGDAVLQESLNLIGWSDITNGIEENGAFFEYRIIDPSEGYYRLKLER